MNRPRREVVVRLPDGQRSVQNIVRQHAVRNIHHAHFRINTENHALHHPDEVVTRPVVGGKRNDRPMLSQIILRELSNATLAIYYLLFDANGRMQSCQVGSRQEVTLDCFCLSQRALYHLHTNGHLQSTSILLALMCHMSSRRNTRTQLEGSQKAVPLSGRHLSAGGSPQARIRGQFLIANLELEFNLSIPESATYNFLIANKMRFFNSKIFALPRAFSGFEPRASSL